MASYLTLTMARSRGLVHHPHNILGQVGEVGEVGEVREVREVREVVLG